jgi:DNA-binding NarL/FixJ family response regulator
MRYPSIELTPRYPSGEPTPRYARTSDDVTIAYTDTGHGPALVWLPAAPLSNVSEQWHIPWLRDTYERLASRMRLVLYDARGTGQSQRNVEDIGLEPMLRDLDAVVGHAPIGRFALLATHHAVAPAIAYAARNPQRVTRLVLFAGSDRPEDATDRTETDALLRLVTRDWDGFVDVATDAWLGWPLGDSGQLVADAFRHATSPEVARAAIEAARDIDVTDETTLVRAPALVLHRRGSRRMKAAVARKLASALPNGVFRELPGTSTALFVDDPNADCAVLMEFLAGEDPPGRRPTAHGPDGLTPREVEVLRLIAAGATNADIADRLGLSIHTIERHAANLYRRIGVHSRAEAAAYAVRRGIA